MIDKSQELVVVDKGESTGGEIQLQRRGEAYEIISNGVFLMATYNGLSERLLVRTPLAMVEHPKKVLIGGLGVGFSLAEALSDQRVEQATVVEIEEKIIEWNESYLAKFSSFALSDPRTLVVHADLVDYIQQTEESFDVICLDIDNGPDWTVTDKNQSLYQTDGLTALQRILQPNGVIAFWSAAPAQDFAERLSRSFSYVEEVKVEQERGEPDCIYLVREPRVS